MKKMKVSAFALALASTMAVSGAAQAGAWAIDVASEKVGIQFGTGAGTGFFVKAKADILLGCDARHLVVDSTLNVDTYNRMVSIITAAHLAGRPMDLYVTTCALNGWNTITGAVVK